MTRTVLRWMERAIVFIADAGNNRVVEIPAGGGAQTTVGSGLTTRRAWRWMERAMSSSRIPTTTG